MQWCETAGRSLLKIWLMALALLWIDAAPAQACSLRVSRQSTEFNGVVVGVAPLAETLRQTKIATMVAGGELTARFAPLPRILADYRDEKGGMHRTIAAVTDGRIPSPGALVLLRSRYLDPDDECHYIPWTVVGGPSI